MNKTSLAAMAAAVVVLASCGGNGGSKNKYPDSELFGNVLALQCQYADQDSILKAEMEEADKNTEWTESGVKKYTELKEKTKAKREQAAADLAAGVEQAKATLIGRDIPFEVAADAGYEVTELKVSDIDKRGTFFVKAKIRVTDAKVAKSFDPRQMDISWYEADAEGNDTKVGHGMQRLTFPAKIEVGSEVETGGIQMGNHASKKSAQAYYNFGKMVFGK